MICPIFLQLCFLLLVYQAAGTLAINNLTNLYMNNQNNQSYTQFPPNRIGIHYPCETDTHCLTNWGLEHTKCKPDKAQFRSHIDEGKMCYCDENYVGKYDKNHTLFCFPFRLNLGDPCDIDEQCQYHLKNAVCLDEGKCGCKEGTDPDSYSGQCFMDLAGLGECDFKNTSGSVNCNITAPGSFCNNNTKLCECVKGTFFLRSAGICVPSRMVLKIGDPCFDMFDGACSLIENSICQHGLGQCHCMTLSKDAIYYGEETPMKCINEGYNTEGFIRSQLNPKFLLQIRNNVNEGCTESIQCSNLSNPGAVDGVAICDAGRCVLPNEKSWKFKIFFVVTSLVLATLLVLCIGIVLRRKLINWRMSSRGELLENDCLDYANESFDITTEKPAAQNIPLSELRT